MKAIAAIVVLICIALYLSFGTISPCGMLRESVRKHDNLAAALPDGVLDFALAAQYGALSPGRCIEILVARQSAPPAATPITPARQTPVAQHPAPAAQTGDEALRTAFVTAVNECKARRLSGELKTFVASVQCSNPRILQAFSAANYRYMDLITALTAKRLHIAQRIDRHEITEDRGIFENTELLNELLDAERQRDAN
jgi:hypothetical protein